MSGTKFLFTHCDGKFTDEDLDDEGNDFASRYYGANGLYLEDYATHFGDQMYVAPEEAHDFSRLATLIESRLKSGPLERAVRSDPGPLAGRVCAAAELSWDLVPAVRLVSGGLWTLLNPGQPCLSGKIGRTV